MRKYVMFLLVLLFVLANKTSAQQLKKPKLVVGIVIDQMRAEYLYRFQDNYVESGFKRLIREGYNVKNTHYNYVPTATGPGHTSIYTGTTPANHGIVANSWYNRRLNRVINCVEDSTVFLVDNFGITKSSNSLDYARSPKNIKTSTITDELKLFTNSRSKVIGVSLKDRGAICPAGHLADVAYWYNTDNGHFITSTYYSEKLPEWLINFNNQKKADSLLNLTWKPLLPIDRYVNSNIDNDLFEKIFTGKKQSTFPYNLKALRSNNGKYGLLKEIPYGNTLLTQFVKATIQGEQLGKGKETDFLTVSYSSTDYVGHNFGIRSKELEDTYVRMDREISLILETLDTEVGKNNYILFLTADHGGSDNPVFLKSKNLPGAFYNSKIIKDSLNRVLSLEFGTDNYISHIDKTQIYLAQTKISKEILVEKSIKYLKTFEGIKEVFAPGFLVYKIENSTVSSIVNRSYHPLNSGDIILNFYSGWMEERAFGTTHGNAYPNDTHVPLLWYGWNIPHGKTVIRKTITQIAPTLSMLLDIPLASASNIHPIHELFKM